jgi:serine/threonine protein phosphatase PrpC
MKTASVTCVGLTKRVNQDRFLIKEFSGDSVLIAVADGAGGTPAGEEASGAVIERLNDFQPDSPNPEEHLVRLMQEVDQKIFGVVEKEPDLKGMGTTLTAAFVRGETVFWAHVGDSRLYLFRDGELTQITEDDTMAGFLLTEGEITREEARVHPGRNFLFDFIGSGEFEEETGSFTVRKDDLLLLTTDGLHDRVPEEALVTILRSNGELDKKLDDLVSTTLQATGKDDLTVVGLEI